MSYAHWSGGYRKYHKPCPCCGGTVEFEELRKRGCNMTTALRCENGGYSSSWISIEAAEAALERSCKRSEGTEDGKDIADNMMEFLSQGYSYSLKPGELKTNNVSEFLFEKKKGFSGLLR